MIRMRAAPPIRLAWAALFALLLALRLIGSTGLMPERRSTAPLTIIVCPDADLNAPMAMACASSARRDRVTPRHLPLRGRGGARRNRARLDVRCLAVHAFRPALLLGRALPSVVRQSARTAAAERSADPRLNRLVDVQIDCPRVRIMRISAMNVFKGRRCSVQRRHCFSDFRRAAEACASCGCTLDRGLAEPGACRAARHDILARYDYVPADHAEDRHARGRPRGDRLADRPRDRALYLQPQPDLTLDHQFANDWGLDVQLPLLTRPHSTIAEDTTEPSHSTRTASATCVSSGAGRDCRRRAASPGSRRAWCFRPASSTRVQSRAGGRRGG